MGCSICCITDQLSIKWLLTRDYSTKFHRCQLRIGLFNPTITYAEGRLHKAHWFSCHCSHESVNVAALRIPSEIINESFEGIPEELSYERGELGFAVA